MIKFLCISFSIIIVFMIIRDIIRDKRKLEEEDKLSELKKYYENLYENNND